MADFIERNFAREVDLLKALVRVPSDNPPGDCARHAEAAAKLFEGLGFKVERHPVPAELVKKHGMASVTNLLIPEENGAKIEKALMALIKRAAKGKGISVECKRVILAEPLKPIAGIERLVEPLQRHARRELKTRIPVKGVPLYTDARHYSAHGVPTVLYGAGPRSILDANAHGANEHVKLADLKAATRVIEATLRDVLRSK